MVLNVLFALTSASLPNAATPALASRDEIVERLNRLEAENAQLRARIVSLEALSRQHDRAMPVIAAQPEDVSRKPLTYASKLEPSKDSTANTDWNGVYFGLSAGVARTRFRGFFLNQPTIDKLSGLVGGMHVGGDLQIGRIVLGGRAQIEYNDVQGVQEARAKVGSAASSCIRGPNVPAYFNSARESSITCRSSTGLAAEISGRAGYTFLDNRLLAYGHGGIALGRVSSTYESRYYPYSDDPNSGATIASGARWLSGVALGAGAEYRANDLISIGVDYTFRNFGSKSLYSIYYLTATNIDNGTPQYNNAGPQPQDRVDNIVRVTVSVHP